MEPRVGADPEARVRPEQRGQEGKAEAQPAEPEAGPFPHVRLAERLAGPHADLQQHLHRHPADLSRLGHRLLSRERGQHRRRAQQGAHLHDPHDSDEARQRWASSSHVSPVADHGYEDARRLLYADL